MFIQGNPPGSSADYSPVPDSQVTFTDIIMVSVEALMPQLPDVELCV